MSYALCSTLGYYYNSSSDFCVSVGVLEEDKSFRVHAGWISLAFFLGLLIGVGIVLLLAKPFLEAWEKKKRQDEEKMLENVGRPDVIEAHAINGWTSKEEKQKKGHEKDKKVIVRGKSRFWRKRKMSSKDTTEAKEGDVDPAFAGGMIDVLLQTNTSLENVEMADQDMASLLSMERGMQEEKDTILLKVLAILLKKKMEKKIITQNFYVNFMTKVGEDLKDMEKMIDREKEEAEEKLKSDQKLSKDSQTLETEMQKLQTFYNNKQATCQRDFRDKIRLDLIRSSGMSDAEVDDVMSKLMKNVAVVEEKIGLEQARQRRNLEERLAKRRQALEYREMEANDAKQEADTRLEAFNSLLDSHAGSGDILEKQRDELVMDYGNDLDLIKKYHAAEFNQLSLEKAEALQQNRLDEFYRQNKKHEKEKNAFLQTSDKMNKPIEFIKLYHDLMTKQHLEQEALCGELDQLEVQEIHKVKQDVLKKEKKGIAQETDKLAEKLEATSNVTMSEAERLIKLHKQQMSQYSARKQKERQAMLAHLQERLQQRLMAADAEEAKDQKEQETLKEQQMAMLEKVLNTNMDLTDDAKERVLREHEQNMQALSNQLLRSKLRQQKSLEIKLNQRKAKLMELKQEKEDLARSKKDMKEKQKQDIASILDAQIANEEQNLEDARKTAVAELRRQLAEETDAALKQQDEEIGLLIGRIQVGQARRKAIIEKQDVVMKELQDQLERQVSSGSGPSNLTDQIIQQHYNNVTHLNEQIMRHKERQESIIRKKLAQKRDYKEQEMELQLEEDAQTEYSEQQKRGAGYASLALMQSFLEQRHARALQELETEMKAELEKSRADLNVEMEIELRAELDTQKQTLLTQLAAVSNVSKAELQDVVDNATKGKADPKLAKRLAKDLKEGVERAKTSLSMHQDDDADDYAYRRTNTDLNYSQNTKGRRRSSAGPKRVPRQGFMDDESDEDY